MNEVSEMNENTDALDLRYVPLSDLATWSDNPKIHDFDAIKQSIRKYGFKDPPKYEPRLNNNAGGIVEGNGRIEALIAMKRDGEHVPRGVIEKNEEWYVPVLFGIDADTEASAEAYAIDHNNIVFPSIGTDLKLLINSYNIEDYGKVLNNLRDINLPVSVVIKDVGTINDYLTCHIDEQDKQLSEYEEIAQDIHKKWGVKYGDVYSVGEHRVACGDCKDRDIMDRLTRGRKASFVFTDPPYDYEDYESIDTVLLNYTEDANIFVMHSDRNMVEYLKRSKLEFVTFFVIHAHPYKHYLFEGVYVAHIMVSMLRNGKGKKFKNLYDGFSTLRKMKRKIEDDGKYHIHQKPISVVADFILHYSDPGDWALDMFAGSGTLLFACASIKRRAMVIDIEESNVSVILERANRLGLEPRKDES